MPTMREFKEWLGKKGFRYDAGRGVWLDRDGNVVNPRHDIAHKLNVEYTTLLAVQQSERGLAGGENPMERVAKIFNGRYTIQNSKTGEHRTFMIRTQPDDSRFAPGKRVVALLTGPDNETDYTGFGFVDDWGIKVWHKHRGEGGKKSAFDWYAEMLWSLATRGEESAFHKAGYRLLMEGRCIRCNRTLTDPESIRTGIGPTCAGRE